MIQDEIDIVKIYREIIDERNSKVKSNHKTLVSSLDCSRYLENYLLPVFNSKVLSKELVFSILIFINYKISHRLSFTEILGADLFKDVFDQFSTFHLINDLNMTEREIYTQFLINCFNSIEEKCVSSICLKLVSILIWVNLSKETLKSHLVGNAKLIEKWKMLVQLGKKENILNSKPCTYMNNLLENYLKLSEECISVEGSYKLFLKFLELLIDLISQYSSRKFLLPLIKEKHLYERFLIFSSYIPVNSTSAKLFNKMLGFLKFYIDFEINDETCESISKHNILSKHYDNMNKMQNVTYQLFPDKLSKIYLKNICLIDNTNNIKDMLDVLNDEELFNFALNLNLIKYTEKFYENKRTLIYELFISKFERKLSLLEKLNNMSLYPDEDLLWDKDLIPDEYSHDQSLPLPKLNLQFLTHYDYLIRNFTLFRYESIFEIRQDIEDVITRMHPKFDNKGNFSNFNGWAKMGIPIKHFKVLSVKNQLIGKNFPEEVIAEIEISYIGLQSHLQKEWDKLKKHDVLFMTKFKANLDADNASIKANNFNISRLRGCEVLCIYDDDNKEVSSHEMTNDKIPIGLTRKIHVMLDSIQYSNDLKEKNFNTEEMSNFHLLIQRKPKQNNFKPILETIRDLMNSITVIPSWMEKIFLGYGDPQQAQYTKIDNSSKIDMNDTFIDEKHFEDNFVNNEFIQENSKSNLIPKKKNLIIRNYIRFTKKQIEAIYSGVHKGLTLIVGPPGTGKTDVAVQIISLLYHNFPNQRTLVVTHSNFALNDIFKKIAELNIDEKYLLRLGIGQKDLHSEKDFTRNGRINLLLNRRIDLTNRVLNLAHSLDYFTFEEYTCEHALNFYKFNIKPLIYNYTNFVNTNQQNLQMIEKLFPFKKYFNYTFKYESDNMCLSEVEKCTEMIKNIEDMFREIEELRFLELLRNNQERGNYLLTKQAKIIAMTCTHAALKRRDFIKLGFEYDNIIIEEAAQILEVETFIPMLLQNNKNNDSKLKRIVLIGDINQLPPIIKSNAFKLYGRMDQSLFSRLIRTGVPYVQLDWQGRTRPSIVDLYRWKYLNLKDLPDVLEDSKHKLFNFANPGFIYEYQFINVPDYDSKGEICPSPHYYQNLAEAEFVIATYMFMCLIGYDPSKITILATYNGQKALLKDIFNQKCSWNPIFNKPAKITTVDKYQGQQNDYILLSLVRTFHIGYIRDIRRLVVSLSRARLGLYIFGRWNLYSNCYEIKKAFDILDNKPKDLKIILNEEFPVSRKLNDLKSQNFINVEDFRHMYRIVQEMLKIKFSSNKI